MKINVRLNKFREDFNYAAYLQCIKKHHEGNKRRNDPYQNYLLESNRFVDCIPCLQKIQIYKKALSKCCFTYSKAFYVSTCRNTHY